MKPNSRIIGRIEKYSPKIFEKSAIERNQIAYIPQFLSQASLPKDLEDISEWRRCINKHTYSVISPSSIGVPGGAYSRLILIRINTLAKLTKSPVINLGLKYAEFMNWMGLNQSGGTDDQGNVDTFKESFVRCINCVIHQQSKNGNTMEFSVTPVIESAHIQSIDNWHWEPMLKLSDPFFEASQKSAPIDIGALKCLSPGTLRMDIFCFLSSRLFYLKKETLIRWIDIEAMFATPNTVSRSFRQSFRTALAEALVFYEDANVSTTRRGLLLKPSRMLIQPIK